MIEKKDIVGVLEIGETVKFRVSKVKKRWKVKFTFNKYFLHGNR